MTIGYKTNWPRSMGPEYAGKPNHFVEKIWKGYIDNVNTKPWERLADIAGYNEIYCEMYPEQEVIPIDDFVQKIHTMRHDAKDRWKVGMKIHPVINNRTKNRFQFAPVLEVKGIQKIDITICSTDANGKVGSAMVWIDDKYHCC